MSDGDARARLWVAGILGGLAAIVVVAVVVFQVGRKDPSPPSLEDDPNLSIPGRIVYADGDNCLWVAEASGASRSQVACVASQPAVSWADSDAIRYADFDRQPPRWVEVDIATGEMTDTASTASYPQRNFEPETDDGAIAVVDDDGTVFRIEQGQRTEIFDADYPEYSRPDALTWSPDGQWLLLMYWPPNRNRDAGELWIVARDGSFAGTLATDVSSGPAPASWWIDGMGYAPEDGEPATRFR